MGFPRSAQVNNKESIKSINYFNQETLWAKSNQSGKEEHIAETFG